MYVPGCVPGCETWKMLPKIEECKKVQRIRSAEFIIGNQGVETDKGSGKESVIANESTTFISSGEYQEQLQAEGIGHLQFEIMSYIHTRNEAIKNKVDEVCAEHLCGVPAH